MSQFTVYFDNEDDERFNAIRDHLGIKSKTEVVRHVVKYYHDNEINSNSVKMIDGSKKETIEDDTGKENEEIGYDPYDSQYIREKYGYYFEVPDTNETLALVRYMDIGYELPAKYNGGRGPLLITEENAMILRDTMVKLGEQLEEQKGQKQEPATA